MEFGVPIEARYGIAFDSAVRRLYEKESDSLCWPALERARNIRPMICTIFGEKWCIFNEPPSNNYQNSPYIAQCYTIARSIMMRVGNAAIEALKNEERREAVKESSPLPTALNAMVTEFL